jgi:hypothetical protein
VLFRAVGERRPASGDVFCDEDDHINKLDLATQAAWLKSGGTQETTWTC